MNTLLKDALLCMNPVTLSNRFYVSAKFVFGHHQPRRRDTDRALDLGMAEQKPDGPKVSCASIDQGRFGSP
jgi:hypothetical protein